MKILPILNHSLHNKFQTGGYVTAQQFNYGYNLPCDTVAFANNPVTAENVLSEREQNTASLIKRIKEGNYDNTLLLDGEEWEPNYCLFDKDDNNNKCLMEVIIDRFDELNNDKDFNSLITIAELVIANPDFEIENKGSNQDLLQYAIDEYCPEVALSIIYSSAFDNIKEKIDLKPYIMNARKVGLDGVAESLEEAYNALYPDKALPANVSKPQTSGAINKALSIYKVTLTENDPKSLDEVGGMFKVKKDITEFILKPWNKDFRDKIIANRLNRPSGFLLSGPPGCGKTYIMKAIAAETGYNLYEINLSNIGSSEGYATQNELKNVFDNLEKQYKETGEPSILVLDELDSIAMNRKNCHTDWKKDDINALLMVMNNSAQRGIIIVGATNNPEDLDDAVKRSGRLDKHIKIGLPEFEERKDIVERILQNRPIGAELLEHSAELAEKFKGHSPADISSILHNACLNAIYEYKDTADMEDFNKMFEALKRDGNDKGRVVIKGYTP